MKTAVYISLSLAIIFLVLGVFTKLGFPMMTQIFSVGQRGLLDLTVVMLLFGANFALLALLEKK